MEIRVAKTAGFCFGVKRAVDLTYGLLNEGCKVATLGPLIHNPQAVEDMQKKGALVADAIADVSLQLRQIHVAPRKEHRILSTPFPEAFHRVQKRYAFSF